MAVIASSTDDCRRLAGHRGLCLRVNPSLPGGEWALVVLPFVCVFPLPSASGRLARRAPACLCSLSCEAAKSFCSLVRVFHLKPESRLTAVHRRELDSCIACAGIVCSLDIVPGRTRRWDVAGSPERGSERGAAPGCAHLHWLDKHVDVAGINASACVERSELLPLAAMASTVRAISQRLLQVSSLITLPCVSRFRG